MSAFQIPMKSQNAHPMMWEHPPIIHIVEHDPTNRTALETFLRRKGFTIQSFRKGEEFLVTAAQDAPDIVMINVHLSGMGGVETLARLQKLHPKSAVIFLSGKESADTCAQAARLGDYDIILMPFQETCLMTAIRNALQKRELIRELDKLKTELRVRYDFTNIIGSTPAVTRMVATLKRLAVSDVPVILHGERGAGKELAARTLHYNSRFAEGPFVCVNCSVLRSDLDETEILSSLRGKSPNRDIASTEKWMRAKGGTLFLDDITELELPLLNKLLQQLKSCGHFQPGERTEPIDFRIICGTRKDISSGEVNLEAHSEFFRLLAPFQLRIPSLRNRTDDIQLLFKRFLTEVIVGTPRQMPRLTSEAMRLLKAYPWPGNIQEFRNVIRQAFLLNESDEITAEDLPSIREYRAALPTDTSDGDGGSVQADHPRDEEKVQTSSTGKSRKNRDAPFPTLKEAEERLIRQALEHTNWNVKRTASLLQISRPALYRRIEKLKISRHTDTPFSMDEEQPSGEKTPDTPKPIENAVSIDATQFANRVTP